MLARIVSRRALSSRVASPTRRLLTTAAAPKKGTWKGATFRWGLAGAAVYYYNTNDLFAEQEEAAIDRLEESIHQIQQTELSTIEAVVAAKRERAAARAAQEKAKVQAAAAAIPISDTTNRSTAEEGSAGATTDAEESAKDESAGGSIEDLEAEAGQQGAFNPETGEINWDCPCLGGMAHGPCGEDFREAFSCFVYSEDEPKGMDCIEKFKGMQDCFRAHPDVYASELEDEEDEIAAEIEAQEAASTVAQEGDAAAAGSEETKSALKKAGEVPSHPEVGDVGEKVVPRTAYDAADAAVKDAKA